MEPTRSGCAASHAAPPRRWCAVVLDVPERLEEELAGRLVGSGPGAETLATRPGWTRLRIYRPAAEAAAALAAVRGVLRSAGLDPLACGLGVEAVPDEPWVERYQSSLRPFALGRRFLVLPHPTAEPAAARGERVALRLVPGGAFGTGEHPTTRLCVELLEQRVRPGSRWVDLGCGSAILALVAAHCGAAEVLALDHDGQAVAVAREVVAANALDERIRVEHGTIGRAARRHWEGIVANIDAAWLRRAARRLAARLGPAGWLLASGVLSTEQAAIGDALESAGLVTVALRRCEEWIAIEARRPGGPAARG